MTIPQKFELADESLAKYFYPNAVEFVKMAFMNNYHNNTAHSAYVQWHSLNGDYHSIIRNKVEYILNKILDDKYSFLEPLENDAKSYFINMEGLSLIHHDFEHYAQIYKEYPEIREMVNKLLIKMLHIK